MLLWLKMLSALYHLTNPENLRSCSDNSNEHVKESKQPDYDENEDQLEEEQEEEQTGEMTINHVF